MAEVQNGRDFVLAIDFGGTKTAVGTASFDGSLLRSARFETDAPRGAAQAVERGLALARELVTATTGETGGECIAAGAVSPGIIREDGIALAPNVPGWGDLRLPALLRAGLELDDVPVANDVNAAALAETRWGALRDADPALFVNLGTGIKAGIVIGGRVLTGASGAAGEIGYSVRDPADGSGFAEGRAPLEEFVGGRAIGERASSLIGTALTAEDAFARDDLPPGFIEETLAELSMHVANLAIALDPSRIAVGGGLMGHADRILPALRERLSTAAPFPPELVPARFPGDGALRGAVALALDSVVTEAAV